MLRGRCQLRESCWQQCARCESIGPHRSNFGPEYLPATHGAGEDLDGGEHLSEEEDEEQEDEDEDADGDEKEEEEDVDGKEEASGTDAGAQVSRVCIVTADYAMQNVALQMGLRPGRPRRQAHLADAALGVALHRLLPSLQGAHLFEPVPFGTPLGF